MELEPIELSEVIKDINASSEITNSISMDMTNGFMCGGKTLQQWSSYLKVVVPRKEDIDSQMLQRLFAELVEKIQTAAHFVALARSMDLALKTKLQLNEDKIIEEITKTYDQTNGLRRPGKEIIKSMARSAMIDAKDTQSAVEILKDFWTKKYDALIEVRKCLEAISMARSTDLKYQV